MLVTVFVAIWSGGPHRHYNRQGEEEEQRGGRGRGRGGGGEKKVPSHRKRETSGDGEQPGEVLNRCHVYIYIVLYCISFHACMHPFIRLLFRLSHDLITHDPRPTCLGIIVAVAVAAVIVVVVVE